METGDCKLCLSKSVDLRASHFLPRSLYTLMRSEGYASVYISKESMYSSTKQVGLVNGRSVSFLSIRLRIVKRWYLRSGNATALRPYCAT
jgi:hypothetical protein